MTYSGRSWPTLARVPMITHSTEVPISTCFRPFLTACATNLQLTCARVLGGGCADAVERGVCFFSALPQV